MTALATINPTATPTSGNGAHWIFPESFAATCLELRTQKVAPSVIVWMPKGLHVIRPLGKPGPIVWNVHSAIARVADRHLQAMRAKAAAGDGPDPYFDFGHNGGRAGEPVEFFWDELRGVCAFVRWSAEGERAILCGGCNSFSPEWICSGPDFIGLRANVGALLYANTTPAFGAKMPRLQPVLKREEVKLRARMFMQKVDRRAQEIRKASQTEFPALEAFAAIQAERPELFDAHELMEAIADEFGTDNALTHG